MFGRKKILCCVQGEPVLCLIQLKNDCEIKFEIQNSITIIQYNRIFIFFTYIITVQTKISIKTQIIGFVCEIYILEEIISSLFLVLLVIGLIVDPQSTIT